MQAVLFNLDQTLHDRAASLATYIAEHHGRLSFSHVPLEIYKYTARNSCLEKHGRK